MAAGRIAAPGTEFGPCIENCNHKDCKQTRDMAAQKCHYCDKPIGYDTRFYFVPSEQDRTHGELVHALCHEEAIENEQARDLNIGAMMER